MKPILKPIPNPISSIVYQLNQKLHLYIYRKTSGLIDLLTTNRQIYETLEEFMSHHIQKCTNKTS